MKHGTIKARAWMFLMLLNWALLAWVAYSLYYPVRTLEIRNMTDGQVLTEKDTYKLGETVGYQLDFCKFTDAPVHVARNLVDGQLIQLSTDKSQGLPLGCHSTLVTTSVVPMTVNPGRYYLDISVTYDVNLLRSITVHYHTNYFSVVK